MNCKQLEKLPVVAESQIDVLCPNCNHYFAGKCNNPHRVEENDPCPFDGKELKTKPAQQCPYLE